MTVLLLSTYDLGRQPFGLASPAAWLERAGHHVISRDLSRDPFADADAQSAQLIAFYLPMHTATRLAVGLIAKVRAANPHAALAAYGLYAPLSEAVLRDHGIEHVLGPEAEADLVTLAGSLTPGIPCTSTSHRSTSHPSNTRPGTNTRRPLARLSFITPSRGALPSLDRYATVQMPDGTSRIAGATAATRGCRHRCRHCPIVPIYDGQFRVVPVDIVLADVAQQVAAGAQHITFGDPDFFNGPTHARRVIEALHARHPEVTYDVTIKIEHLLAYRDLLPVLAATGCLFVISAVEAVDDEILAKFEKRHTRADFFAAAALCRAAGVILCPTFVAFTPWTTLAGYADLLDTVESLDLVEHVAPVQWGLRLLVTHGSRLLELDDIRRVVQPFDRYSLTYPWMHPEPRVDALQQAIMQMVGVKMTRPRAEVFDSVRQLMGHQEATTAPIRASAAVPYLNEPWYC